MKITKRFIKNLIKEVKGDESCPVATQEEEINTLNKGKAAVDRKIAYMHPADAVKILELVEENKFCGNCAAFDITPQMVDCGGANSKGTTGYCKMHDFSCAAEKTCLTWATGGPKK
jgi:hypothetical protein